MNKDQTLLHKLSTGPIYYKHLVHTLQHVHKKDKLWVGLIIEPTQINSQYKIAHI